MLLFLTVAANRLANFNIGANMGGVPQLGKYTPLFHEPKELGAGERRVYKVKGVGRSVFVQLRGTNYLTLCEVTVRGSKY